MHPAGLVATAASWANGVLLCAGAGEDVGNHARLGGDGVVSSAVSGTDLALARLWLGRMDRGGERLAKEAHSLGVGES